MRKEIGYHHILRDVMRRIAELERRGNNPVRPVKITDVDPDGSRQPGQVQSAADGEPRMRVVHAYTPTDEGEMPVLSSWQPWQCGANGNIRDWWAPTVGEQGLLVSFSNEPGVHNSIFLPTFYTKEDGEKVKSTHFTGYADSKVNRARRAIEPKQKEMTLKAERPESGAEANSTKAKPDPKDEKAKYSVAQDSYQCDYCTVDGADNSTQTKAHEETWPTATKTRFGNFADNTGEHTKVAEDIKGKKLLATNVTPAGRRLLAQTASFSADKTTTAQEVKTVNQDKTVYKDKTGGKAGSNKFGSLDQLWKGSGGGGGGQNKHTKTQTAFLNQVDGESPSGQLQRIYKASGGEQQYYRFTTGSGSTTVTQGKGNRAHTGDNDTMTMSQATTRKTSTYLNNAMQSLVEHAGQSMKLGSGGGMGISSGGSMSIASGGSLKLAGMTVKIGGPVKLSKSFLGFGGTMAGGGGSGAVNSEGAPVDEEGNPIEESPPPDPEDESPPPDEIDLFDKLDETDIRLGQLEEVIGSGDALGAFGYAGTSPTLMTIGTGEQNLLTQSTLSYDVGSRIRLSYDPTHWMEGVVTAYTDFDMTVDIDLVSTIGGTYSTWALSIAGVPGLTGPQGEPGVQGPPGPGGPGGTVPTGGYLYEVLRKNSGDDFDVGWHSPAKADVGLGNVDNTADLDKPVSNAVQGEIDTVQGEIDTVQGDLDAVQGGLDALETVIAGARAGYLYGLTLSNGSDATNDIDITAGMAACDTAPYDLMTQAVAGLTKRLDAAWAVGDGNGGRDTGSIANTTYHVFLIQRSDTGVVDALFSTSATAPTMPANYDRKRRIGSIVRTSSAIKAFVQDGDDFSWATAVADVAATSAGTAAVTRTLTVPVGIRVQARMGASLINTTAGSVESGYLLISDLSIPDVVPTQSNAMGIYIGTGTGNVQFSTQDVRVFTNTSGQLRTRCTVTGAGVENRVTTKGWQDTRGRLG